VQSESATLRSPEEVFAFIAAHEDIEGDSRELANLQANSTTTYQPMSRESILVIIRASLIAKDTGSDRLRGVQGNGNYYCFTVTGTTEFRYAGTFFGNGFDVVQHDPDKGTLELIARWHLSWNEAGAQRWRYSNRTLFKVGSDYIYSEDAKQR